MNKPMDWEKTKAANGDSSFKKLPAGGYVCEIKSVREVERFGNQFFHVAFDICEGEFKDYFINDYNSRKDRFGEADWGGVYEIAEKKKDGNTNPFFKGFFSSVEESNTGYKWDWNENSLKGKKIGILIRERYYMSKRTNTPTFILEGCNSRSVEKIRSASFEIPEPYKPENVKQYENTVAKGFTEAQDDDLPF